MSPLELPDLELELISLLKGQGLPVEEIRLIGLLGKGTKATVFSVLIDGVYHVLKVYDSKESLKAELKHLRKMIPKSRLLFVWQGQLDQSSLNLALIEVPEGRELTSDLVTPEVAGRLADRLSELHRIRYRQKVSVSALVEQLNRSEKPVLEMIDFMERDRTAYIALIKRLKGTLSTQADRFRINKVRIHGDLWWPNVIVSEEDVYLVDWESVRRGEPAEDIGKLRLICYLSRNDAVPAFFWKTASDGPKLALLVQQITERHQALTRDQDLVNRLKFYLPFFSLRELADRYLEGKTRQPIDLAWNQILADEALSLADNPLAMPPSLTKYGYFAELETARQATQLELPAP